jgi:hypothetical protein
MVLIITEAELESRVFLFKMEEDTRTLDTNHRCYYDGVEGISRRCEE